MKTIPILTAMALLGATQAFATTWAPSDYRCSFDQLNTDKSKGRVRWAQTQSQRNAYGYNKPKDYRFWAPQFTQDATDAYANYQIYIYPVYTDPATYEPWVGPGAYGSQATTPNSWTKTGDEIALMSHTEKQAPIFNDGVCEPGCYAPDQEVLFSSGVQAISGAQSFGRADLITLAPDATLDKLTFMSNPVQNYTLDKTPARQTILDFFMESGGQLSVTQHHPLITRDGAVVKAMDFTAGDYLVKQDGTFDRIVTIDQREWVGKVYNLRPKSRDLVSNVLVAQGYLNGSLRYQSEYVEELNRIILRDNVPDDVVPGE